MGVSTRVHGDSSLESQVELTERDQPKKSIQNGSTGRGSSKQDARHSHRQALHEHIDLGIKYDPSIGIFGMDFFVVLTRPGSRVTKRRRCRTKIGASHRLNKEEAQRWFQQRYDGILMPGK